MTPQFVATISQLPVDELHIWLIEGLTESTNRTDQDVAKRPAMAFRLARLSFGQMGDHRNAVDELAALFLLFDNPAKLRFHQAIQMAIDLLPLEERTLGVLDCLIELTLDTKCNLAINAITRKLLVPSADLRRLMYLQIAFLFDEADAPECVLHLAKVVFENNDYPQDIAARLLVALCRYDVVNAPTYAQTIHTKLAGQLKSLRTYPAPYGRFRFDFSSAVAQAPNSSTVIESLLAMPQYVELLDGYLQGHAPATVTPGVDLPVIRTWHIDRDRICATAIRKFFPMKSYKRADTIALLDSILHAIGERRTL